MHCSGGGVDNWGAYACVGAGDIWKISVPSPQFCCAPKTTHMVKQVKFPSEETKMLCHDLTETLN